MEVNGSLKYIDYLLKYILALFHKFETLLKEISENIYLLLLQQIKYFYVHEKILCEYAYIRARYDYQTSCLEKGKMNFN